MSLITTLSSLFGRRPALPSPPKPSQSAPRIMLRDDDLNWRSMDAVMAALPKKHGVEIRKNEIDLNGAVIDGRHITHPKNRHDENSRGILISVEGLTLINGWVIDVPGGAVVKAPRCRFGQLRFLEIGEDALSTTGREATDIRILECQFWNDREGDKSIQLNQSLGAQLTDVLVVGGITGARFQKADYGTPNVVVRVLRSKFVGCDTAINVDGGATIRLSATTFENVKKKWKVGEKVGGRVIEAK